MKVILKVILVEDEYSATQNMLALLAEIDPTIQVLACLQSVEDTIKWLSENPDPDAAFFDIQLVDGSSFEIFEKTVIKFPIIFTTAYDEYALRAFKVNSIDYLLKPIKKSDLVFAINKYRDLTHPHFEKDFFNVLNHINQNLYTKKTLLIKKQDGFVPLSISDFAFFYTENTSVYATTFDNKKMAIDDNLDSLEKQISNTDFFRANRQFIVSRKAIVSINYYFNGRLSLKTQPDSKETILVSKARVPQLKMWLEN